MAAEYRITPTNEITTRGDGGVPTESERAYTVEAVGEAGNYQEASLRFFQWALSHHACDPWGNPVAEGGIELTENPDSVGRLWYGRIRWAFPTATEAAGADAFENAGGAENDDGNMSSSERVRWYPYVSSFSTAGGTAHLTSSFGTRAYPINGEVVDFGGGIGWNGDGFEGVDVPTPSITFEITARTPEGFLANFAKFLNKILPYVGTVNATKFYGCDPGTVLFNGITSGGLRQGTSSTTGQRFSYWEMTFHFSASPNGYANVDGHPIPKGGWEYLWSLSDDSGKIQATYVETVFRSTDFRGLGLGGNF